MNKQTKLIIKIILGVALLLLVSASALGQDQSPQAEAGQISAPLRSSAYPEALYPHGIIPDWDRGYVIHYEIEVNHRPDTPMVVMYDATGKRVREGRIWPQGAGSVTIRRTAATRDGAILASGWAIMQDGSIQHFIVKTDLNGNTVQTLQTGPFLAEQICGASDGTVWSLGKMRVPIATVRPTPTSFGSTVLKRDCCTVSCRKIRSVPWCVRIGRGSTRLTALCDAGRTKFPSI